MAARIGSLFHQGEQAVPMARPPGRWRTVPPHRANNARRGPRVAQAASPGWNCDATSSGPQRISSQGNGKRSIEAASCPRLGRGSSAPRLPERDCSQVDDRVRTPYPESRTPHACGAAATPFCSFAVAIAARRSPEGVPSPAKGPTRRRTDECRRRTRRSRSR